MPHAFDTGSSGNCGKRPLGSLQSPHSHLQVEPCRSLAQVVLWTVSPGITHHRLIVSIASIGSIGSIASIAVVAGSECLACSVIVCCDELPRTHIHHCTRLVSSRTRFSACCFDAGNRYCGCERENTWIRSETDRGSELSLLMLWVPQSAVQIVAASTIAAATDHLNPSNDATIVFALYASEYQLVDDQRLLRIVNIEKIDSSGSTRSLTGIPSTTIQAYIEYIRSTCTADCGTHSISNESSLPRSVSLRIHVFSRSQPQYLFPASKQHAEKRVRDDTSLVQWWMWVLGNSSQQTITEHARHSDPATTAIDAIDPIDPIDAIETIKRWWVIPGETVHSTTCARLLQGSTCKWEWGLCSDPSGRLPQFPDDPVSKACGMLDNNNHEVHSSHLNAVIDMLSVLGECQRVCAVLCLQIDSDPKHCKADLLEPATDSTKPSPLSLHHSIPQSDMKVFMASWMGFDFSSVDACVASSRQIVAMFHESFGHLNATTSTTVVSQSSSSSLTKPLESRGTASGINNLQGLVKRNTSSSSNDKNPTPSQTPSYTAQSIQGLVKRKPALSTTPVAPQLDHDNNPSSTIHHLDASSIKKQKTV
ncbi:hypothetical protein BASA61_005952 [Batrachochytrium salamandrivorans]|nr:hypothetical protein BASA61_005952 [Batrachochytrium salamandrivorans]